MVTSPIRVHVRNKLRQASAEAWGQRAVQGQMPRLITEVFRPALDPALYTRCAFSESWYRWALSTDHTPHDLSAIAFRCQRAIGGSWTERVHAHEDVAALARHWSQHAQWPSTRTCPLCRSGPGTPRHVVMACGALAPLVDMLRDDIEAELQQVRPFDILVAAAQKWRTHVEPSLLPAASPAVSARWPVLSAWRWLVPLPSREPLLSVDVQDSSAIPTARERGWDLAYRGVLPKSLGATLCSLSIPDLDSLVQAETELYASLRQPGALHAELRQFSKRRAAALPAVRVVKCLLLGLRRIRFEYQARLTAWLSLCRAALPPPPPEVAAEQAGAPSRDALQAWLTTGSGLRSMQELRWALLPPRAAVARLQSAYPRSRLSADSLLAKLFENSGAVLQDSAPYWGPSAPTWQVAIACLSSRCSCPPANNARIMCCWTCGGSVLPVHTTGPSPCHCCHNHSPVHCASCNCSLHFRGQCRWNQGAHTTAQIPASLCALTAGPLG